MKTFPWLMCTLILFAYLMISSCCSSDDFFRSPIGVSTVKKIYGIRSNNGSRFLSFITYYVASNIYLHILVPHIGLLALEVLLGKLFRFFNYTFTYFTCIVLACCGTLRGGHILHPLFLVFNLH